MYLLNLSSLIHWHDISTLISQLFFLFSNFHNFEIAYCIKSKFLIVEIKTFS